jgi:alanine racemase
LELEGLMTHLAMSSTANQIDTDEPSASFSQVIEDLKTEGIKPKLIHVGQSSGSLRPSSEAANAIRLGIGLYGVNPFDIGTDLYKYATSILNPALKAQSTITHINILKAGDSVGYGYTYTAKKSERIGVIPFGYYDGLNRETLSNRGFVKIGDSYAPIVGRICMNHTMINLDNIQSEVGDTVTIYSNNKADRNSIDQLAREFKLFNYSMLTSLAADTRRILVD